MLPDFPHYQALMAAGAYVSDKAKADSLFKAALNESFAYHLKYCPAFANYCANRGFFVGQNVSDIASLPFVPVQAFKAFGQDLLVTKAGDEETFFMNSSATSGAPSSINVSRSNAKRQAVGMARVISEFLGSKKCPFIIFDVKPKRSTSGSVGARYGATVGYMSFSSQAHFVLEEDEAGGIRLNLDALARALQEVASCEQPPVIFGFTYVIFDTLKRLSDDVSLAFFQAGTILHIGGWKKLESQKVSKADFNQLVSRRFGLTVNDVVDVYGFTEQMGVNYPSFGLADKVAPNFARVLVRDPDTLELLPPGQEGLLQFVSPLPLSYPGVSVLTDDLGMITAEFGEIQGRFGTQFQITGRAKNAEVRGCGDIMSSYLSRSKDTGKTAEVQLLKPRLLFWDKSYVSRHAFESFTDFDNLPDVPVLDQIDRKLSESQAALKKYSVDDLISFFAVSSTGWLAPESPMRHLQQHGLSFLVNWLAADNLRAITNKSLKGSRAALDRFVPDAEFPLRQLRATPRGIVGHWLAGNVPLLGMLGLVQAILTKNANIIRVPASNSAVMPTILDVILNTKVTLPNGTVVDGQDIAASTVIIYYDKFDTEFAKEISQLCDARIAWGGAEAVSAVAALPTKIDCQTVIYGPKLSYMAIAREELGADQNTEKLFRRIATDCSVFDQYACASPHTVFVETNDQFSPQDFCERLAHHMSQMAVRLPKESVDAGTASVVISKRIEHEFRGQIWQSEGTTWTIVHSQDGVRLADPTYSRFVTVKFVEDILQAAELAHPDIQTVSVAMPYEKKIRFAEIAAARGAVRFPDIGRMTHFETPWDGIFLMDRLVRFVTLGGPAV
jgi:hypothetical protein